MDKEETLFSNIEGASRRLRGATAEVVAHLEPLDVIQRLEWQCQMLRAELNAVRDQLRAKGQLDSSELQARTKDNMEKITGLLQRAHGFLVRDDGSIVATVRADKNISKVHKKLS